MSEEKLTLKEFVQREREAIEQRRADWMDEQGFNRFVVWPKGGTAFTLQPVIPRSHKSFGKEKMAFTITVDEPITITPKGKEPVDYPAGSTFDWSVNPISPDYGNLVDHLIEAPVSGTLFRTGEGTNTRYELVFGSGEE